MVTVNMTKYYKEIQMLRTMLISKLHHVTVREVHLDYSGSLTIDSDLLDLADIKPYEKIEVYNMNNGARFATYAIPGERGSGMIAVNGAAARLAFPGDSLIIATYGMLSEKEMDDHKPKVIILNQDNKVEKVL